MRVLIIGASFGGLTVANRLLRHVIEDDDGGSEQETENIDKKEKERKIRMHVDIVDALRPPSADGVFVGDITVPAAPLVLAELGLLSSTSNGEEFLERIMAKDCSSSQLNNNCDISRQELLDCLRKRVNVKYHHAVQEIVMQTKKETTDNKDNHQKNNTACWAKVHVKSPVNNNHKSGETNQSINSVVVDRMGPYDAVVIATGTRSQFRIRYPTSRVVFLLAVGDARYTRWWDFGQHRIRQGANQALLDGLELGNALWQQAAVPRQTEECDAASIVPGGKFRLSSQHDRAWRLYYYGILLAIVAAIVMQYTEN